MGEGSRDSRQDGEQQNRVFIPAGLGDRTELCVSPMLLPGSMIPREVIFTVGTVHKGSQDYTQPC